MADYKPNWMDELINLLPSLIAPTLQYKVAKDGQKAQMDRLNVQLQAQKDLAKQSQDFQIEQKEIDRDIASVRAGNEMAFKNLQLAQQALDSTKRIDAIERGQDISAYTAEQAQKHGLLKQDKSIEATRMLQEDMLKLRKELEKEGKLDLISKQPVSVSDFLTGSAMTEPEQSFIDESAMIEDYKGMKEGLKKEVNRVAQMSPRNQQRIDVLNAIYDLQSSFENPYVKDQWFDDAQNKQVEGILKDLYQWSSLLEPKYSKR